MGLPPINSVNIKKQPLDDEYSICRIEAEVDSTVSIEGALPTTGESIAAPPAGEVLPAGDTTPITEGDEETRYLYKRGFNPSSLLCSHYSTWEEDSEEHTNYRLCCDTQPDQRLPEEGVYQTFLQMRPAGIREKLYNPGGEDGNPNYTPDTNLPSAVSLLSSAYRRGRDLLTSTSPNTRQSTTRHFTTRQSTAMHEEMSYHLNRVTESGKPGSSTQSTRQSTSQSTRQSRRFYKLGRMPNISPEDTDTLLEDFRALKHFLCPPGHGVLGGGSGGVHIKTSEKFNDPWYRDRPFTQPVFPLNAYRERRDAVTTESMMSRHLSEKRSVSSYGFGARVTTAGQQAPTLHSIQISGPWDKVKRQMKRLGYKSNLATVVAKTETESETELFAKMTIKQTLSIKRCKSEVYDDLTVSRRFEIDKNCAYI